MIVCSISKVGRKGHKKNIVICSTRKGKMNMDICSISIAKVGNKKNTKSCSIGIAERMEIRSISIAERRWKFVFGYH